MKRISPLFTLIILIGTIQSAFAQPQFADRGPRFTIEERVDRMTTRLYVSLELTDSQMKSTKSILTSFFEQIRAKRHNTGDCISRDEFKTLAEQRDNELKEIFSETQYEKYEAIKQNFKQKRLHRKAHRNWHKKR